jgi:hypothetical protein
LVKRQILGALAALAVLSGCGSLSEVDSLESVGGEDGSGELCIPLSEDGYASFAWETVRNKSGTEVNINDRQRSSMRWNVVPAGSVAKPFRRARRPAQ